MEGSGVVIEDEDVVWDVCVDIFERYNGEYSEEMKPFVEFMAKNRVVVRLDVDRVRSWDHRKLGMPAMELGGIDRGVPGVSPALAELMNDGLGAAATQA